MQEEYLKIALELAKKGVGHTSPNPTVGAVIVKNKKIIGKGYHKKAGGPHAETVAMESAKGSLKGATLYVTLEPCSHVGKTPPCTDAIIRAGIRKVVIGMRDPNPKVNGRGAQKLKRAGVKVEFLDKKTALYKDIRTLNQPFIKWMKTGLPLVTMKAGMSLDGKIATKTGKSKWITSPEARKDARLERSMHDAVLVGSGTVAADNPTLAAHGPYKHKKLLRVIIDATLTTKTTSTVFRDSNVFVACTDRATKKQQRLYEKKGIAFKSFGKKRVSIKKLLQYLGKQGIQSVYVEGGAGVHGSFCDAKQVDQVLFYIAPKIIGGDGKQVVAGSGVANLGDALGVVEWDCESVGVDIKLQTILQRY